MPNRLADAISPYLLQHKDNPVNWWPWSAEALAEARRRDVPILLSVGYSACHWCHVMAHETFEDETVAEVLNAKFVAIKVDREERPDIDAVYMQATNAMTGQGGWPMTCVLTPAGEPVFAGTYLPRAQFLRLIAAVDDAWTTKRDEVQESGSRVAETLSRFGSPIAPVGLDEAALSAALEVAVTTYDGARGGFGGAPKFPPSMMLEWLLRHHARTGDYRALAMAEGTCAAMARGGMYDQLAGGFARYAVDPDWVVPHFEKMLYDNAQLLPAFAHLWRSTGLEWAKRVGIETGRFLLHDLGTPEGGFAAALDADTDGVEGHTYVWTPDQLIDVLGHEDGEWFAAAAQVTPEGTFEHGASTVQRELGQSAEDLARWESARALLLAARATRPQPARDDKVVTSWNGLAIAALAEAGEVFGEPAFVDAAASCADFLVTTHLVDGRLRRLSRHGVLGDAAGVADDYGNLAHGLLVLHQVTGEAQWLEVAGELLEVATQRFAAPDGGFYDSADDASDLFHRPRGVADNAEPSSQSSLGMALLEYGALTGSSAHLTAASAAIAVSGSVAGRDPRFAGWALATAEALAAGPLQVAIVHADTPAGCDDAAALRAVVRRSASPGLVVAVGVPDAPGRPLLRDRPLAGGAAAAYVCRGFVCDTPVTDPQSLAGLLGVIL